MKSRLISWTLFLSAMAMVVSSLEEIWIGLNLLNQDDSQLPVAPVVFHYINYFKADGIGGDQLVPILTGANHQ